METKTKIYTLLEYKDFYKEEKDISHAKDLITGIPSSALLNYIAGFGVHLYLNEHHERPGIVQFNLANSLLNKCDNLVRKKWQTVIEEKASEGHNPIMFWNYSNLIFLNIIFKNFNGYRCRDLTGEEAKKLFDAYLIINGIANQVANIDEEELKNADESMKIEEVTMPGLIYQRDYVSSLDFGNQATRGIYLFKYLESENKFKDYVREYYKSLNISGYLRMLKNLMVVFVKSFSTRDNSERIQIVNLKDEIDDKQVDPAYLETLCINSEIGNYKEDESFGVIRRKFLYKFDESQYLILNINFLLDHFYKAQIFAFNGYLKMNGAKSQFLSEKGKNFSEDIYLKMTLESSFPDLVRYSGNQCLNSKNEELCDAYLREGNKVCLIEFKDVLLASNVKNSSSKEILFEELDKKFVSNQSNKPKGITQLANAIFDIEVNSLPFDDTLPAEKLEIFPVIIYTDNTFGMEGLNKYFKEKFKTEIEKRKIFNAIINDVIFINLSFFELNESYINQGYLNFFDVLASYNRHVSQNDFSLTSFEVFARAYNNENIPKDLVLPNSFQKHIEDIAMA